MATPKKINFIKIGNVALPPCKRGVNITVTTVVNNGRNTNGAVVGQKVGRDQYKITVDFGEAYPVNFDVVGDNNTISITGNNVGKWKTEEVLRETKTVTFKFYKMKSNAMRVRIKSILCGLGLTYTNDSIINSTLETNILDFHLCNCERNIIDTSRNLFHDVIMWCSGFAVFIQCR